MNAKANTEIGNIDTDGSWVNLEATVLKLWNNEHPSIRQVGLLKDDTGIVKFISWEKSNLSLIQEGVKYSLTNLVVGEYEDRFSVKMNKTTEIERVTTDEEIPTV